MQETVQLDDSVDRVVSLDVHFLCSHIGECSIIILSVLILRWIQPCILNVNVIFAEIFLLRVSTHEVFDGA